MGQRVEVLGADVAEAVQYAPEPGDVMVVDPPRAGLGPEVCRQLLATGPQRIVYISCNPVTQLADWLALQAGYRMSAARGFDLFPQTFHMENVVVLERL
jgi:tRNA/tmRNA/rRNA uracil-C5-methylase (TrmA/RlmC/RlmD family)